jgi:hypothetical protein
MKVFGVQIKTLFLTLGLLFTLTQMGCYMRLSVNDQNAEESSLGSDAVRSAEDFTQGETVETDNGYVVTGVFGEISEKQVTVLTPGWEIEPVFGDDIVQ